MLVSDIKLGLRVRCSTNGMTALVVGKPEYNNARTKLVRIKYENSTRYEYQLNTLLQALPLEEQYAANGGVYVKPEGDF